MAAARDAIVITVLVDDEEFVREALCLLLGSSVDLRVVGQAADGEQAVALARRLRPDVVLMDLVMPVLDGAEATRRIISEQPDARVVVFAGSAGKDEVGSAIAAGATGAIMKSLKPGDLLVAIRAAASNNIAPSP